MEKLRCFVCNFSLGPTNLLPAVVVVGVVVEVVDVEVVVVVGVEIVVGVIEVVAFFVGVTVDSGISFVENL